MTGEGRPDTGTDETARLRQTVELLFRRLETIAGAMPAPIQQSEPVRLGPRLPPRSSVAVSPPLAAVDAGNWWPSSRRPSKPLVPTPGLGCQSLAGRKLPTTAVIVFELHGEALDNIVDMIATRQRRNLDFKPVFLTNASAHGVFRRLGYAFEFLPRAIYGPLPHLMKTARAGSRMKLLQAKWDFSSTIDLTRQSGENGADGGLTLVGGLDSSGGEDTAANPADLSMADAITLVRESGLFDEVWYRRRYLADDASGADPLEHYLTVGAQLGHDPTPMFSTLFYARQMMARAAGRP